MSCMTGLILPDIHSDSRQSISDLNSASISGPAEFSSMKENAAVRINAPNRVFLSVCTIAIQGDHTHTINRIKFKLYETWNQTGSIWIFPFSV